MICFNNISKRFSEKTIFDNFSGTISSKRLGLTGVNGSGKSTLMKIIKGLEHLDSGTISHPKNAKIKYLSQTITYSFEGKVADVVKNHYMKDSGLQNLYNEEKNILAEIEHEKDINKAESLYENLIKIQGEIESINSSKNYSSDPLYLLKKLGFTDEMIEQESSTLSGGWLMRLALAVLMSESSDMIMFDEPTNYLDIETVDFLKEWIDQYKGYIILVSHDRAFLNSIVTEIWEIICGRIEIYKGNYDYYLSESVIRYETLEKTRNKQLEEIEKLQEFVDKFRYNANTASRAQSKLKELNKVKSELIEIPERTKKNNFKFPEMEKSGKIAVEIDSIFKNFGKKELFTGFSRIVNYGEKIGLAGRNGIGKSTLLNIISGKIIPDQGNVKLGSNIKISYFRQNEIDYLPEDVSVLEYIESNAPFELVPKAKSILSSFLFFSDSWDKKLSVLSGGEKMKIAFIKMLLNPGNLFLMDEPTTHLDIDSKEILLKNLKELSSTVIFVSHDQYFIDSLSTSIVAFSKGFPENFPGNYSEYKEIYKNKNEELSFYKSESEKNINISTDKNKVNNYELAKKNRNYLNKLSKEIEKIEENIAENEDNLKSLSESINNMPLEKITETGIKINKLESEIKKLMELWEEKNIEIEKLKGTL